MPLVRKEQLRDIPLTVAEYDGSPSVYPVDSIAFSGATVIDQGGGNALVAINPPSTFSLTLEEGDGSPVVANVDRIIFSGASLTDLGNGDILVTIVSSGIVNPYSTDVLMVQVFS